jgi:preprotein translocase subunit Sec61beta
MSRKDKTYMPQSSAGLMRYFDQSKESIKIKPEHVLVACVILVAIEIMIKFIA